MEPFNTDVTVLRWGLPFRKGEISIRWLLWPAWAWQVVAPQPRRRKLNLFQRATLGLCVSGVRRAVDIGPKLRIGVDLAAFVMHELEGMGWLGRSGVVTDAGRRVLEEDESEPADEQTVGWVFTDPFSGETWPRFLTGELPCAEVEAKPGDRWELVGGTAGKPQRSPAFAVRPRESVRAVQPRPDAIVQAVRAHRQQHAWQSETLAADAPSVQRVSFVSEAAMPCLLATRAWGAPREPWRVDDPFGIGESARLRRWIEERFDKQPALRSWLDPVAGGDPSAADLLSLVLRAEWEVESELTVAIRERALLHERLVAMKRALLEAEMDGSPDDKWDDVALKAQLAAERLFQEMCAAHPARSRLTRDVSCNVALLDELARAAGFETPLPDSLAKVRSGKVEYAHNQGAGSLRPMVLLALLGTAGLGEHPLARAAQGDPRLLHKLDALAAMRDRAAHESPGRARGGLGGRRAHIREGVNIVFSAVKLLPLR